MILFENIVDKELNIKYYPDAIVVFIDGKQAGYVNYEYCDLDEGIEASIQMLEVDSKYRGSGLGTKILLALKEKMQKNTDPIVTFVGGASTSKGSLRLMDKVFGKRYLTDGSEKLPNFITDDNDDMTHSRYVMYKIK